MPVGKLKEKKDEKIIFFASLKSLKRGAGSGGWDPDPLVRGANPGPHQNVRDPQC